MPRKQGSSRASTKPVVVRTSEITARVRPDIVKFIESLGYAKKKAEAFADGYLAAVAKLPLLGKLRALTQQDDHCMAAGFKAAGISEEEALKRRDNKM
ncbi:MAG: hypothetical protein IT405_01680 [Candidatus Yanofskybacteria bacterium]|nr:hypothetical protein [Candidatus Yanofskybacteria bacterium]